MKRALGSVVVGWLLACSGVGPPSLPPTGGPPSQPEPESPLVMGQRYWFDKDEDKSGKGFDVDRTFKFEPDGRCRHQFESRYHCTYTVTQTAGRWKVDIIAYTDAQDPDGKPVEVDLGPEQYRLDDDGRTLVGPEGQVYLLQPPDDRGR